MARRQFTPEQLEAAFWAKVDKNGPIPESRPDLGPCWVWTAFKDRLGYGYFHIARRSISAYTFLIGKAPTGLEWDHLCHNPACVRPNHLEAITHAENIRRGNAPSASRAYQRGKTHCPHGHEYTPENTYLYRDGRRSCRICMREYRHRRLLK